MHDIKLLQNKNKMSSIRLTYDFVKYKNADVLQGLVPFKHLFYGTGKCPRSAFVKRLNTMLIIITWSHFTDSTIYTKTFL